jgi:hypothetical protein
MRFFLFSAGRRKIKKQTGDGALIDQHSFCFDWVHRMDVGPVGAHGVDPDLPSRHRQGAGKRIHT